MWSVLKFFILGLLLFICSNGFAQQVTFKEDPAVSQVMDRYKAFYKSQNELSGYRIQILATQDKRKMERELTIFENRFPYMRTRTLYLTPYYKVQVGAFYTRLEAERELYKIKRKYPSAYTVRVKDIRAFEILGA